MNTHYQALEIAEDATDKEIRAAWKKAARLYHPDRNPGNDAAEARFKSAAEAQRVLLDPAKRLEYDQELRASRRPRCRMCHEPYSPKAHPLARRGICMPCVMALAVEKAREIAQAEEDRFRRPSPQPAYRAAPPMTSSEQQRLEEEFGWVGDMNRWDDMIDASPRGREYEYDGAGYTMTSEDLLAALVGDGAVRAAQADTRRHHIRVEISPDIRIQVDPDTRKTMGSVSRSLKSAERIMNIVRRWFR
jgi:curved DNA-binding protein CbpA